VGGQVQEKVARATDLLGQQSGCLRSANFLHANAPSIHSRPAISSAFFSVHRRISLAHGKSTFEFLLSPQAFFFSAFSAFS
jgi:hypothetical protein